jgi:multiple antibiotic resistance protein
MRSLVQAIIAVLAIADPLGAVPVFISLTREMSPAQRAQAARRAAFAVGWILTLAALFGSGVLDLFGVSLPAFRAGGGLVVLLMGLEMLSGQRTRVQPEPAGVSREDTLLVPFAMPLIAGPGAITTVVALSARASGWRGRIDVLLAVAATALVVFATLRSAERIQQRLSDRGHRISLRFMGMILVAVGAQLIFSGIQDFFGLLPPQP